MHNLAQKVDDLELAAVDLAALHRNWNRAASVPVAAPWCAGQSTLQAWVELTDTCPAPGERSTWAAK